MTRFMESQESIQLAQHTHQKLLLTLHVSDLTVIEGGGGDIGEVNGKKAAKPVTTVQDCVLTSVSVKPQDTYMFEAKT